MQDFCQRYWLLLLLLSLLGGCGGGLDNEPDVVDANQQTAARIKVAIAAEPMLSAAPLNIVVRDGVAHVEGFVETETQRQRLAEVVAGVPGVRDVVLQVVVK